MHQKEAAMLKLYHKLWKELHTQKNATEAWFNEWLKQIPRRGCKCKNEIAKILKTHPPRYDDWFNWTVELHNAVNTKLGHKELSIDEAATIWNRVYTQ